MSLAMRLPFAVALVAFTGFASFVGAQPINASWSAPDRDRWMYPFADNAGGRALAPAFSSLGNEGPDNRFDDRDGQMLVSFSTGGQIPAGLPGVFYRLTSVRLLAMNNADLLFQYDPSVDPIGSYFLPTRPGFVPDADAGRPAELFAVAFRTPFTSASYLETSPFKPGSSFNPPWINVRYAYPIGFDDGVSIDVSNAVKNFIDTQPLAVGEAVAVREGQNLPEPGDLVAEGTDFAFELNIGNAQVLEYVQNALSAGRLNLMLTSLSPATEFGAGPVSYPVYYLREAPILGFPDAKPARLLIEGFLCTADYNRDGGFDQEDLGGYITSFLSEPPLPGVANFGYSRPCQGNPAPYQLGYDADYNLDCDFNQEDLIGFITAFFQGCGE